MDNWDVLVVAGPSGVGKSGVSYPLAQQFGIAVVEVDDLFHAIEALKPGYTRFDNNSTDWSGIFLHGFTR
jgi:adenylate kinase family enzyme